MKGKMQSRLGGAGVRGEMAEEPVDMVRALGLALEVSLVLDQARNLDKEPHRRVSR